MENQCKNCPPQPSSSIRLSKQSQSAKCSSCSQVFPFSSHAPSKHPGKAQSRTARGIPATAPALVSGSTGGLPRAASSIQHHDCKYSWERDAATALPSLQHIAFPEVKCQTPLKRCPGPQHRSAQPGSPREPHSSFMEKCSTTPSLGEYIG